LEFARKGGEKGQYAKKGGWGPLFEILLLTRRKKKWGLPLRKRAPRGAHHTTGGGRHVKKL